MIWEKQDDIKYKFVLAFLVLGTLGSEYKAILWINFFLDIAICVMSLVL